MTNVKIGLEEKKMLRLQTQALREAGNNNFEKSIELWEKYAVIKQRLSGEGSDWLAQDCIKEYSELLQEFDNDPKKVREAINRRLRETPIYNMDSGTPYY